MVCFPAIREAHLMVCKAVYFVIVSARRWAGDAGPRFTGEGTERLVGATHPGEQQRLGAPGLLTLLSESRGGR